MKPLLLALLSAIGFAAAVSTSAAKETVMYKKVDENGKVIFTDKPIPGSEPVTIKTNTNVVSTPKPRVLRRTPSDEPTDQSSDKPFQYEVLSIDSPSNDEAVRANSGDINVIVGITPNVQPQHSLQLLLDGQPVGAPQKGPYFSLNNVNRGTHQISVQVIDDESNDTVQTSDSVTFHLLRASRLNQ